MKKILLSMIVIGMSVGANVFATSEPIFTPEEEAKMNFEREYGAICETATDGCNTYFMQDGKVAGGTLKMCIDENGNSEFPEWECTKKKETEEMLICTMEYVPVCGVNGVTYGNECSAGNTEVAYTGECVNAEAYMNTLSSNDQSLYNHVKNKLGNDKVMAVEKVLVKYERALNRNTNAQLVNKTVLKKIEEMTDDLVNSYPADAGMSVADTKKYYLLTYLAFELKKIGYEMN